LKHNKVNSLNLKKEIEYLDVVLLSGFPSQQHQGNTGGDATVTEKVLFLVAGDDNLSKEKELCKCIRENKG
jgi:hypothetical protein